MIPDQPQGIKQLRTTSLVNHSSFGPVYPCWSCDFYWQIQGAPPACAPPQQDPILLFLIRFHQKAPMSEVGAPPPPTGNPGSATDFPRQYALKSSKTNRSSPNTRSFVVPFFQQLRNHCCL